MENLIEITATCTNVVRSYVIYAPKPYESGDYSCRVAFSDGELDTRIVGVSPRHAIELAVRFGNTFLEDWVVEQSMKEDDEADNGHEPQNSA